MKNSRMEVAGARPRKVVLLVLVAAAFLLPLAGIACGDSDDTAPNDGGGDIVIGALLDLSGSWQTLGKASQATLDIAVVDVNRRLEAEGRDERVSVLVQDTGLDPVTALEKLEDFHAQGVRIVIGPQSSSELAAVKDFANDNGMMLISQGSTASSLSLNGDNIFRFTPDDRQEAVALVAMMVEDGVSTVQPVCRKDAGNLGLCTSVADRLTTQGGAALPAIEYDPGADMNTVLQQVQEAVGDDEDAAIYLAAFDEAVELFSLAAAEGVLADRTWYGSDGMALNAALVAAGNESAAEFATGVNYPNPIFGLDPDDAAAWQPIFDQVKSSVGYDPDAFALSTYDALNIAVDAYIDAGGAEDIDAFKDAFVENAATNESISGSTELNDAGDRRTAVFDFWAVRPQDNGSLGWTRVATYRPAAEGDGAIERHE